MYSKVTIYLKKSNKKLGTFKTDERGQISIDKNPKFRAIMLKYGGTGKLCYERI